jgi:hypothetical protein
VFRSTSFDNNDVHSTFSSNVACSAETTPTTPAQFCDMNVFQICSWLCANLEILLLAYNMHLASMQTPVGFTLQNFNLLATGTGISHIQSKKTK